MALGKYAVLETPILESSAGQPALEEVALSHWITIQEEVVYSVKVGSLLCELILNGKSSLSFILVNPAPVPQVGHTVKFIDNGKLRFGGFIQTITLEAEQSESVKEYTIECVGWEGQLERHLIKSSYTDLPVQGLIPLAIVDGNLDDDGFTAGYLDPGPPILALVDADYVRASEYLRDIATAGGGAIEISPEKVISFRKVDLREAPFPLVNAEPEYVQTVEDIDDYCNQVTVEATGTTGATANITRADPAEIALRQAIEGGSGVYHVFQRVTHPTSNDVTDLGRLAVSTAFLLMDARARVNRSIMARLRRNLLDVGQLLTVDMPGMNLDGQYQINRISISDEEHQLLYEIDATFTNKRQLNLDSLLKIVQAAKTTIVIDTAEHFQNIVEFTSGATWNVPGIGTVQVEVDVLGAGGGGGGGKIVIGGDTHAAGRGGFGGKAVSFREYSAGTTLTIVVGTGGAGASLLNTGSGGGSSYVSSPTESRVAEGFGGSGGTPDTNGADATGTGDFVLPGSGSPGGAGAIGDGSGSAGSNGKVIIRY